MKDEIANAALKNKVNNVAGAGVSTAQIAARNNIKAALEKAIFDKMIAKTRKVTG